MFASIIDIINAFPSHNYLFLLVVMTVFCYMDRCYMFAISLVVINTFPSHNYLILLVVMIVILLYEYLCCVC